MQLQQQQQRGMRIMHGPGCAGGRYLPGFCAFVGAGGDCRSCLLWLACRGCCVHVLL